MQDMARSGVEISKHPAKCSATFTSKRFYIFQLAIETLQESKGRAKRMKVECSRVVRCTPSSRRLRDVVDDASCFCHDIVAMPRPSWSLSLRHVMSYNGLSGVLC